jgi:hypothetical protein
MIHNTQVRCLHLCHFLAVIQYKQRKTLEYIYEKIIIQTVHKIIKKAILGKKRSKKNCHLRKWKLGSAER